MKCISGREVGCWIGDGVFQEPGKRFRHQGGWLKVSTALRQIRRKHEDEMKPRCGVSGTKGAHKHHLVTAKQLQTQVSDQFTGTGLGPGVQEVGMGICGFELGGWLGMGIWCSRM